MKQLLTILFLTSALLAQTNNPSFTGVVSINPPGTSGSVSTGTVNGTVGYQIAGAYSQGASILSTSAGSLFTLAVRNANGFGGTDICAKIAAALATLPSNGGVVDARDFSGSLTCSSNPFNAYSGPGVLLLPAATITTTKQWITPRRFMIIGQGGSSTSTPNINSTIVADPTITADANWTAHPAIIYLSGKGTTDGFGTRLDYAALDCGFIATSIGVYTQQTEENAGGSFLHIRGCTLAGVLLDQVSGNNTGAGSGTQNDSWHDLNITCKDSNGVQAATVCNGAWGMRLYSINRSTGATAGHGTIHNVTVTGGTGGANTYLMAGGIYLNGHRMTTFIHTHLEFMVDGIFYGDNAFVVTPTAGCVAAGTPCDAASYGTVFIDVTSGNTISGATVHIKNTLGTAGAARFISINRGNGGTIIQDDTNGVTLTNANTPYGNTIPEYIPGGAAAITGLSIGTAACTVTSGTGTPAGVLAAPVCSIFLRSDGGAGTTMYVKESGTGTSGWVAK